MTKGDDCKREVIIEVISTSVCLAFIRVLSYVTFCKAESPSQAMVIEGLNEIDTFRLDRTSAIPSRPYNSLRKEFCESGGPGTIPPPLIHSEPSGVDILQEQAPTCCRGK